MALGFARYLDRRLGGSTGDCLGFICFVGQLLTLLIFSARLP
jgi:cobalamin synthase